MKKDFAIFFLSFVFVAVTVGRCSFVKVAQGPVGPTEVPIPTVTYVAYATVTEEPSPTPKPTPVPRVPPKQNLKPITPEPFIDVN